MNNLYEEAEKAFNLTYPDPNDIHVVQDNSEKALALRAKLRHLASQIDIISDAPLSFLLVAEQVEALPKNSSARANIALQYLINNQVELSEIEDGIVQVKHKQNESSFCSVVDYDALTDHMTDYKNGKNLSTRVWRTLYLMINTIPTSEERRQATWLDNLINFSDNSILELAIVNNVPGVTFKQSGSAHLSLESGWGKGVCDFICTRRDGTVDGEFKRPIKNVSALAAYAYKNPDYIYNAKILYSYGPFSDYTDTNAIYEIDYTHPDYTRDKQYTITKLNIPFDSNKLFNTTLVK